MDNDPNQPQSSSYGQQPPALSQQPPSQDGLPQQPPLSESLLPRGQQRVRSPMRRAAIVLLLLLLLIPAGALVRSVFFSNVVTTLSDDGPGSLRQDIAWAIPGSTITFDANLRGTILLTSGDLSIMKNLTLRGPGEGVISISGGNSGHIIHVYNGASVTISNLTFKDSKTSSSFIANDGTLTLSNSIVSGNTVTGVGGGIDNDFLGTLTLSNSIVSGNTVTGVGGGIINSGTLTLTNSTVSDNTASDGGGGILNDGRLTLTNSTISDNTATTSGGGILNEGALTLTNSTISDNTASSNGGGIAFSGDMSIGQIPSSALLLYCTVYGNTAGEGGGIWMEDLTQGSIMTMGASIVAGNKAHTDPDIAGRLASLGYNLVGDRSGATFLDSPKIQFTDVLGVSSTDLKIDPKLRDNGGSAKPHTWTHALLPGSPAIDLIPPEVCMMFKVFNDQRGVKRPQGKGCDSGAYEYLPSQ